MTRWVDPWEPRCGRPSTERVGGDRLGRRTHRRGRRSPPTGEVVGSGSNVRERDGDPTGHAEIVALREAAAAVGRVAAGRLHPGRDPRALHDVRRRAVLARVDRVVFGAYDDKAGAVGSLWDVVRDRRLNHRPEVIGGVLAEESTALLDEFFRTHRG